MSNRLTGIIARMQAIRLTRKALAARSGLDETTIGRTLNAQTVPLTSTLDKIEAVIAAEEASLAAHLANLGGDAA